MTSGYIDFGKRALATTAINYIRRFQQVPFKLEIVEPMYTFLDELPALDDKTLNEISAAIEPRA